MTTTTTTTSFEGLTLEQLEERARLNAARGIATSQALRDEIARRRATADAPSMLRTKTTYKTRANAVAALDKTLERAGLTRAQVRYLIAVNEEGRFAPVLVGNQYIPFAVSGNITVVS